MNKTMTTKTLMIGAVAATALSAVVAPVAQAADASPAFRSYLGDMYRDRALLENQDWDIEDAIILETQAKRAWSGADIQPHPMTTTRYVQSSEAELMRERARLVGWLNANTHAQYPREMAVALTSFDCWVEQQEAAVMMSHNLQSCRADYYAAASRLPALVAPVEQVVVTGTKDIEALATVHFDFDKDNIRGDAAEILNGIKARVNQADSGEIVIIGHADRSGPQSYNYDLSKRRAMSVANYLGLEEGKFRIEMSGVGETRPAVPTADGVPLEANRRVVVGVDAAAKTKKVIRQ